jgi:type III secretion system TyeA family effector delivery regulator
MSAMTPSSPPAALKEVMDGLYMTASLGTLYSGARDMLQAAERRHGPHSVTEQALLNPLLRYAGLPMLTPGQARADMPFLTTDNPARDAELTQGVRELARKAPHKLYLSADSRQNVLNSLQELLDNAVDREEAAMEE